MARTSQIETMIGSHGKSSEKSWGSGIEQSHHHRDDKTQGSPSPFAPLNLPPQSWLVWPQVQVANCLFRSIATDSSHFLLLAGLGNLPMNKQCSWYEGGRPTSLGWRLVQGAPEPRRSRLAAPPGRNRSEERAASTSWIRWICLTWQHG